MFVVCPKKDDKGSLLMFVTTSYCNLALTSRGFKPVAHCGQLRQFLRPGVIACPCHRGKQLAFRASAAHRRVQAHGSLPAVPALSKHNTT